MLENVRYGTNNNISDDTRIKSSNFVTPSFKGNPNAVDTTPTADTYTPSAQGPQANPNAQAPQGEQANPNAPKEMGLGQKLVTYVLPTGLVLNYSTKLFDHANGGEYEKSLVGRLGKLGDRLSESKLVNNSFVNSLRSHGSTIKKNCQNFIDKHETLSSMQKMPTNPECSFVTNFLETQTQADIKEAANKLTKFIDDGPKTLKEAGATKEEIKAFKDKYGKNALEKFQLKKMGLNPDSIKEGANLKELRMKYLKLDEASLNMIKQNPEKYGKQVQQALVKAKDVSPKMSIYLNKLLAIGAPKTGLGKLFPKMAKLGMRGLTFGGGFLNSMFIAFFLADAVKNTVDAPKDQKLSTGVNGFFDAISWVVAMPLALKGMHALNGLKNLGKTKAQNDAYMTKLNDLKGRIKARNISRADYDKAIKELDNMKKTWAKPKGFKKVLSKIGSFLSIGLEQKPVYKEATAKFGFSKEAFNKWSTKENLSKVFGNIGRKIKGHGPKNMIGYPLRFALYMFAFQPIVDKIFKAPINAIFGKPYDPEKVKEEQAKEAQKIEEARANRIPSIIEMYGAQDPNAVTSLNSVNENDLSDKNLIKKKLIEQNALPPKSSNRPNAQPGVNTNSPEDVKVVNGVQINTMNGNKPFMPPQNGQVGNVPGQQSQIQNQMKSNDPNVSDYDKFPRTYVPKLDSLDVKYGDPFYDPQNENGVAKYNQVYTDMVNTSQNVDKFIQNGYKKN